MNFSKRWAWARHDYRCVQFELAAVLFQTAFENDISGFGRKLPAVVCGESDEYWSIVFLDVGKTAAVVIFRLH